MSTRSSEVKSKSLQSDNPAGDAVLIDDVESEFEILSVKIGVERYQ